MHTHEKECIHYVNAPTSTQEQYIIFIVYYLQDVLMSNESALFDVPFTTACTVPVVVEKVKGSSDRV